MPERWIKISPIVKEIGGKLQFLLMKIQVTNYTNHKILFIIYLNTMVRQAKLLISFQIIQNAISGVCRNIIKWCSWGLD